MLDETAASAPDIEKEKNIPMGKVATEQWIKRGEALWH
jgi:hypothetical protein